MRPPGIAFEDLPHIHAVVLSHNHYDHLDVHTVRRLCKTYDPVFYVPLGVAAYVQKLGAAHVHELDWWQEVEMTRGVRLTAVPANHFSGRGSADRDATLWCGYVIGMQAGRVYFAGDTGYGTFFPEIAQRCGAVDIAMLPIGSYKPRWFMSPIHTSPEEAVAIHKEVGARYSIGMHFGTFPLGDDGQTDPVVDLGAALRQQGVAADRFVTLEEGKAFDYSGGRAEQ
jgi:L-ascorbate metabolism protein UlaG (beta-lactamase superfamily)